MLVKVRKKPAPAVECWERANRADNMPFLTTDIREYCNYRKFNPVIKAAVRNAVKNLPSTVIIDSLSDLQ